jgi:hypothetical protein
VHAGSTIIALANPSGRAQLKAHLIEMIVLTATRLEEGKQET